MIFPFVFGVAVISVLACNNGLHASPVLTSLSSGSPNFIEYIADFNGKSFYGGLEKTTQEKAFKFCEDFGMQLVAFSSTDEITFVASVVEEFFWTSGERNGIWKTHGNFITLHVSRQPVAKAVSFGPSGLHVNYHSTNFRPLCEI